MTTALGLLNWLVRWADSEPTFRNFPPYAAATLLSTLCALAWIRPRTQAHSLLTILGMLVFWTLLGTGLELAQLWIPYRKFDLMDIAWSAAGALAGSLVLVIGDGLWVIGRWLLAADSDNQLPTTHNQ